MSEHITVVLITYGNQLIPERTEYAVRTVNAVTQHLRYPNWSFYVSDDGSSPEHLNAVREAVQNSGHSVIGWHSEHISYGAGCNRALRAAHELGTLTLMLEDDWELMRDLDLWQYAALLMERPDIGMVRMGYLSQGISAVCFGHSGFLYWTLDDQQSRNYSSFAFAGHPALIHRRLFEVVGDYPEKKQPGETELGMAWKVASKVGPKVVWPAALGERGPWGAIGAVQSYEWDGGTGRSYS